MSSPSTGPDRAPVGTAPARWVRLPNRPAFWLVACAFGLLHIGANLPSPLYGVYRQKFDFSAGVPTLVYASYAVTLIGALLLCGSLSDSHGRKRWVITGSLLSATASLLLAAAAGVGWLFAARVLQGVAMGASGGAATAALAELAARRTSTQGTSTQGTSTQGTGTEVAEAPRGTAKASTVATIALAGGAALGPAVSGLLAEYAAAPLMLGYLSHAAVSVAVAAVLTTWRERPIGRSAAPRVQRLGVPAGLRRPFARAAATMFAIWALVGLFLSIVPSYAAELLRTGNLAVLGSFPCVLLGASCLAQLTARNAVTGNGVASGLTMLALGLGAIVLAFPAQSWWPLLAGSVLAGVGHGLGFASTMRWINDVCPPRRRGEVLSALYVPLYVGLGIPVIGVGFLAGIVPLFSAVTVFAVVIGGLALTTAVWAARH
ncbi:MAG: MFS transporter [Pseudonocardiaceae bacterium]|nr:MFS transporter [Pseudonocardiaceae bacterium]